uniref:Relaxin-3 receptor 1 n=1 Tax=Gopherus agassizii TaxID=38772 RepID=A0A452GWH8_9SAUR
MCPTAGTGRGAPPASASLPVCCIQDSSAVLRIVISSVYSVVCALGLVGNLLVLYLMKSKQGWKKSSVNLFVTSLALTDFQFVLTLPFWAVENALDFTWLFGKAMCKIVSYVTAMNMYASVFFLTAMSVARYHSVASALSSRQGSAGCCSAKWLCLLIWGAAMLASLPHAIFSTTATVFNEELCLVKFPEGRGNSAQFWLGLYQAQKVLLGFLVPLAVISLCYLLLLRFLGERHVGRACGGPKRRAKVTRSVTVVVLSFFLCWLPNQALTAWGILVKLNVVHFSPQYFLSQAYLFPVSVCLAHCNSCLNPLLYCLLRREFRTALRRLLWRLGRAPGSVLALGEVGGREGPWEMKLQLSPQLFQEAQPLGVHMETEAPCGQATVCGGARGTKWGMRMAGKWRALADFV